MWHNLLLKWNHMLGVDVHFEINAIIPPTPQPFQPHVVGMFIQGITPLGPKLTDDDVLANGNNIVYKGSDISFLIPHIPCPVAWPPVALAAVIMAVLSGSKSYFGPSSVIGKKGAVACASFTETNVQLNCGFPAPTPTGFAFTHATVVCGMTWGDIFGSITAMVVDTVVQTVESLLCWKAGKVLGPLAGRLGPRIAGKTGQALVEATVGAVISQLLGSPIGYTYGAATGGPDSNWNPGNWGGNAGTWVGTAIDHATGESPAANAPANMTNPSTMANSITNDPGVEQH